jgi:RNA polymerase sigma factor (sigma-70 family)
MQSPGHPHNNQEDQAPKITPVNDDQEELLEDVVIPEYLSLSLREQLGRRAYTHEEARTPEEARYQAEIRQHMQEALNVLTPKERIVIEHYFGLTGDQEGNQAAVSKATGINRVSVGTLLKKGLKKLQIELLSRGVTIGTTK